MSNQDQSPIIEACEVISAQIATITDMLEDTPLNADEIRALRRCELQMSKLERTAWSILCRQTTSDQLLEQADSPTTVVASKRPERPYPKDFGGFGVHGIHTG